MAKHLIKQNRDVAVLGAGTRGEFRLEDQLCCYWLADLLVSNGFEADAKTLKSAEEWRHHDVAEMRKSPSADYLRSTGQVHDLEFVVSHINDSQVIAEYDPSSGSIRAFA